jgi:hypothetical protein
MATRYRILSTKDVPSVVLPAQFAVDINRQGFLNTTQTSISFATTTFTLTDTGDGWSYYRAGVKYTITGNKTVALSAATAGIYYIYIDATDGTLTCSAVNTNWTLLDTKVPVATVTYDSTLTPTYWLADERHTALIDQRMEYYLHATQATKVVSAPTLSGYILNSDVNANKTFAITASILLDQDLKHDVSALTQPNGTATDYVVWYRTAASTWAWKSSNMPFVYNVGNTSDIIQYDNGGTMTNGTVGSARWLNSYLLVSNKIGAARYIIVPGRGNFTTLALAQAESVTSFTWAGFEVDEAVVVYRLTWALLTGTYTSQGKCRLAATPQLINISSTTNASSGAGTDHNTLSNLQGGMTNEYNHLTNAEYSPLNTPATSGKILKSNGTNFIASTETYAAPGTSGNILTSDGTNWLSSALSVAIGAITGLGTGIATALAINVGTSGSPVINGGALGTPTSGTLTNCTGLPATGLVADTTTAIGVGSINLGHASDTTLTRVSAGVVAIEGNNILTTASAFPNQWLQVQVYS